MEEVCSHDVVCESGKCLDDVLIVCECVKDILECAVVGEDLVSPRRVLLIPQSDVVLILLRQGHRRQVRGLP